MASTDDSRGTSFRGPRGLRVSSWSEEPLWGRSLGLRSGREGGRPGRRESPKGGNPVSDECDGPSFWTGHGAGRSRGLQWDTTGPDGRDVTLEVILGDRVAKDYSRTGQNVGGARRSLPA